MTSKAGPIAQMFSVLGVTPEEAKKAVDMLSDSELAKKALHAETVGSTEHISDRWMQGKMHEVPPADTLKVGPPQESSGAGAEHMVKQYSHPAPQMGVQLEAERLSHELGAMRAYVKSLTDAHNSLADAHSGIAKSLTDSTSILKNLQEQNRRITVVLAGLLSKAEDEEEEDEEESEVVEIHAGKAAKAFKKAQKLLAKSKSIKAEAKAASDLEVAKSLKDQAKMFRKAAIGFFRKAKTEAEAGKGRAILTQKAFESLSSSLKADINVTQQQEEDEEEEDEKKARKARDVFKASQAAKAVEGHQDSKGNQADKQDASTGNQDDSAVKANLAEMSTKIDNALSGLGMLKTNVAGLMDAVAGKPVTPRTEPLSMMKGDVVTMFRSLDDRIQQAVDDGMLDLGAEHRARDVLNKLQAVRSGMMTEGVFKAYLEQSPTVVKDLFKDAA